MSVAITGVSEALPASIFKVQKFKIRKKCSSFTRNIQPASSLETQVFIPIGTGSHTRTLEPSPGNIPVFFSPVNKSEEQFDVRSRTTATFAKRIDELSPRILGVFSDVIS